MCGSNAGKKQCPFLLNNHCTAHRLALANTPAANKLPFLKQFKDILDQLYRFYKYSPVRTSGLSQTQVYTLYDPVHVGKRCPYVRWLSHDKAINNLVKLQTLSLWSTKEWLGDKVTASKF